MIDQPNHNTLKHDSKRYAVVVSCLDKFYVKTIQGNPILSSALADAKFFLPENKGKAIAVSNRLSLS